MNVLNCHPEVCCLREPFNPDQSGNTYLGRVHDLASLDSTIASIWRVHNGIKHVWDWSGWPFGQDMTFNLRLTAQPGVRVVLLTRKNHLQRLISYEIAAQTNVWQREDTANACADVTPRELGPLDPASLRQKIYQAQAAAELVRNALSTNRTPFQELSYEDIYAPRTDLAHGLRRVNDILAFLGAGPLPEGAALARAQRLLDPAAHKLNSELTYQAVPNIETVESICGNDETGHVFRGAVAEKTSCDS
jgi:hypothetical protein